MKKSLPVCIVLIAVFCSSPEGRAQDDEIRNLQAQIESLKDSMSKELVEVAEAREKSSKIEGDARLARSFKESSSSILSDSRQGRIKVSDLEHSLMRNYLLLEAYRKSFRIKTKLKKGENLGNFTPRNGVAFTGVVFNGSDRDGIHIVHSNGVGKLKFSELPPEIARHFVGPPSGHSTIDVASLLARKPDTLKSSAQVYADADAKRKMDQEQAEVDRSNQKEKNEELEIKIAALRAKIDVLWSNARAQRESKRTLVNEQSRNKILGRTSKSQADMNRLLAVYDQKIAAINAARAKLETEIDQLQAQKRY